MNGSDGARDFRFTITTLISLSDQILKTLAIPFSDQPPSLYQRLLRSYVADVFSTYLTPARTAIVLGKNEKLFTRVSLTNPSN